MNSTITALFHGMSVHLMTPTNTRVQTQVWTKKTIQLQVMLKQFGTAQGETMELFYTGKKRMKRTTYAKNNRIVSQQVGPTSSHLVFKPGWNQNNDPIPNTIQDHKRMDEKHVVLRRRGP